MQDLFKMTIAGKWLDSKIWGKETEGGVAFPAFIPCVSSVLSVIRFYRSVHVDRT